MGAYLEREHLPILEINQEYDQSKRSGCERLCWRIV